MKENKFNYFEKVNPMHPDKVADCIGGAIVDMAYEENEEPKVAVEVLIGHGVCHIITESSVIFEVSRVEEMVRRITKQPNIQVDLHQVPQDVHLADNQVEAVRCGDNGIFKGVPLSETEKKLSKIAREIYEIIPEDGKYVLDDVKLIICQSNIDSDELYEKYQYIRPTVIVNPLGDWTGGTDVDTGATNRKLGSDMAQSVTGGGLHGKDLSKADVSVNIYCFCKAQETNQVVVATCAIGDGTVTIHYEDEHTETVPFEYIVNYAKDYINAIGGFEKFSEWGLV